MHTSARLDRIFIGAPPRTILDLHLFAHLVWNGSYKFAGSSDRCPLAGTVSKQHDSNRPPQCRIPKWVPLEATFIKRSLDAFEKMRPLSSDPLYRLSHAKHVFLFMADQLRRDPPPDTGYNLTAQVYWFMVAHRNTYTPNWCLVFNALRAYPDLIQYFPDAGPRTDALNKHLQELIIKKSTAQHESTENYSKHCGNKPAYWLGHWAGRAKIFCGVVILSPHVDTLWEHKAGANALCEFWANTFRIRSTGIALCQRLLRPFVQLAPKVQWVLDQLFVLHWLFARCSFILGHYCVKLGMTLRSFFMDTLFVGAGAGPGPAPNGVT